ncbi:MAG: DUF1385 domain-containing protein [Clostridia bacterium]|nr:DUF1385 domain-containing protein [Clostridia bacterium]
MSKCCEKKKPISVGGQALLEGIMMKGPQKTVMATRMPEGNIELEDLPEKHIKDKIKCMGWPVIRGSVNMVESFIIGYKALMKSAEKLGLEEEEEVKDSWLGRVFGEKLMAFIGGIAMVLGVALAVVLFMLLPTLLFNAINSLATPGVSFTLKGLEAGSLDLYKGLIEGVTKIFIFVGYVAATALMSDIKRTYMYHGAEHKSIFCFEAGEPLTVENVRKQSRFHPRCGTSFLLLMLVVSILVSSSLLLIFPALKQITWLWVTVKILILPLLCGLGYELIRVCGKHQNIFTKIVAAPGLWMQRLTTKEPEDDMIEVAIASLKEVLPPELIVKDPNEQLLSDIPTFEEFLEEQEEEQAEEEGQEEETDRQ